MNQEWQDWVKENLERGCWPQDIYDTLRQHNFDPAAIEKAMGPLYPGNQMVRQLTQSDYKMINEYPGFCLGRFPGAHYIANSGIQLFSIEDFLTHEECDKLVIFASQALRPSTLTVYAEGFRTSMTGDLHFLKDPFLDAMEAKFASALDINQSYAEFSQAQKYLVGQEFKPHTDYFEPHTAEYDKFGGIRGQRTWTLMVYLNETPKGGGTQFVKLGRTFYPKKGTALAWNNLYPNGQVNPDTMHWGMPVEEGEKYIITKWFREQGNGPMFENI